jgi:hypothetical protein
MTTESISSQVLTAWQTLPLLVPTAGEGADGYQKVVSDYAPVSTNNAVGSTYRMCRIPTYAKVKSVWVSLKGIDSNATATAVLDINIAFSNSPFDGTPAALQDMIPTSALTGAVTTVASYSSPNKLFGTIHAANSGALVAPTQVVHQSGTGVATWFPTGPDLPLWDFFGFTNNQGYPADPNGYFELMFYMSTGPATAAAGNIWAAVEYVG